jgi:hypothetical protein
MFCFERQVGDQKSREACRDGAEMELRRLRVVVVWRWELWAQTRGSSERGGPGKQISLTIVGSSRNGRLGQAHL